jgi:hypothetical protein
MGDVDLWIGSMDDNRRLPACTQTAGSPSIMKNFYNLGYIAGN